ncbi:hypothetical protein IJG20_02290 [Candidatus Saccharibacteria bacterium]|nr:hypothetical protein [Candidatus Saccharibacteria bacterium]
MNKFFKRLAIFSLIFGLIFAGLLPLTRVYATDHGEGEYRITASVDSNADWLDDFTIDGVDWSPEDAYLSPNGSYFLTFELHVPNESVKSDTGVRVGGDSGSLEITQVGEEEWQGTHRKFTYTATYSPSSTNEHVSFNLYSEDNGGDDPLVPEGNKEAMIILRGGEGSYEEPIYDMHGEPAGARTVPYSETYHEASFAINDSFPQQMMPEDVVEGEDYSRASYFYNAEEGDKTVSFTFSTLWHLRFVDEIIINNESYTVSDYLDYDNQADYLNHYSRQIISFTIPDVPIADTYDISVKVQKSEHTWIGNFLWTSDPEQQYERRCEFNEETGQEACEYIRDEEGNLVPGHNYIGNSNLALVSFDFTVGNTIYYCDVEESYCSWWTEGDEENAEVCTPESGGCDIRYIEFDVLENEGFSEGSLVVPAGARITMQVIPDYGYQVMNVNMAELETDENGVGRFTFTVPDGAAYFVADVVETEDTVNADAESISSGTIDLGDNQTSLEYGTAQLNVSDVELSEGDITGFKESAGDYDIKTYLDISLYNVVCRGGETCDGTDSDAWVSQIDDLNEEATITFKLEEGIDGNEVVIVHQKHDGTYEVIPTVYDPLTNTITFKTSSFSNYAIASRTVASPNTGSVTSEGESAVLMPFELLALGSVVVFAGFIVFRRHFSSFMR